MDSFDYLESKLGKKLALYLGGFQGLMNPENFVLNKSAESSFSPMILKRWEIAQRVCEKLIVAFGCGIAANWFVSSNRMFAGETPAFVIRNNSDTVRFRMFEDAADHFIDGFL